MKLIPKLLSDKFRTKPTLPRDQYGELGKLFNYIFNTLRANNTSDFRIILGEYLFLCTFHRGSGVISFWKNDRSTPDIHYDIHLKRDPKAPAEALTWEVRDKDRNTLHHDRTRGLQLGSLTTCINAAMPNFVDYYLMDPQFQTLYPMEAMAVKPKADDVIESVSPDGLYVVVSNLLKVALASIDSYNEIGQYVVKETTNLFPKYRKELFTLTLTKQPHGHEVGIHVTDFEKATTLAVEHILVKDGKTLRYTFSDLTIFIMERIRLSIPEIEAKPLDLSQEKAKIIELITDFMSYHGDQPVPNKNAPISSVSSELLSGNYIRVEAYKLYQGKDSITFDIFYNSVQVGTLWVEDKHQVESVVESHFEHGVLAPNIFANRIK